MRERGTAAHISAIMLCAFVAKCFLWFYIEEKMEIAPDDEESEDDDEAEDKQ